MSKKNLIIYIILGVSLLANAVLLGFVIGQRNATTTVPANSQPTQISSPRPAVSQQNATTDYVSEFDEKLRTSQWKHKDGFRYPVFMKHHEEEFLEDIPADVERWTSRKVELCYWPLLGAWATMSCDYPIEGSYLSNKAKIKDITYNSSKGILSGHTTDGRIFYMKEEIIYGPEVDHASSLVLIYPKEYQSVVTPLIDAVRSWKRV